MQLYRLLLSKYDTLLKADPRTAIEISMTVPGLLETPAHLS
jgi:hypothetical protein